MKLDDNHPLVTGVTADSALVKAFSGVRTQRLPVWFMRQAGRSLPEYRALRVNSSMLQACLTPELACEITLQPVRRYGVDAAVFFSDIVVPLKLAGVAVDIVPGTGPVLSEPIDNPAAVDRLTALDPAATDWTPIAQAVRLTVRELGSTPLIGFAGAPYTLACYLVEGGPSKTHLRARAMMHSDPASWRRLMDWAARASGAFLAVQAAAGASVVQLFDSWVGSLSREDYERYAAPYSVTVLAAVDEVDTVDGVGAAAPASVLAAAGEVPDSLPVKSAKSPTPIIRKAHFGVNNGELLAAMHAAGADVMGVDATVSLTEASQRLGGRVPLQGNLDPARLFAPWEVLREHMLGVIRQGLSAPAHILNLGHGVPPEADCEVLARVTDLAHSLPEDLAAELAAVTDASGTAIADAAAGLAGGVSSS